MVRNLRNQRLFQSSIFHSIPQYSVAIRSQTGAQTGHADRDLGAHQLPDSQRSLRQGAQWGHEMLTDVKARQAAAKNKDYKIADSGGLLLFVAKSGRKTWRYKYRKDGKEHRIVLGAYPEMKLSEARTKRDLAKIALKDGRDPKLEMKKRRLVNEDRAQATFEKYARLWWKAQKPRWKPVHADDVLKSMERDLFPTLGNFPLNELDGPLLLAVLEKVEERGAIETAGRLRQRLERIFRYAKAKGAFTEPNPAVDIKEAMAVRPKGKRWPALTDLEQVRELVKKVDLSKSFPVTRLASRFLAIVAQRPGMVHAMRWDQIKGINWPTGQIADGGAWWLIESSDMKVDYDHRGESEFDHDVFLPTQAIDVLITVRKLTGAGKCVFPNARDSDTPMSESALSSLYRRQGYTGTHVPHGWRGSFSTIMNEHGERTIESDGRKMLDRFIIDLMLAHKPKGMSSDEFAYNRAKYKDRRKELAAEWADLICDEDIGSEMLLTGPVRRTRKSS